MRPRLAAVLKEARLKKGLTITEAAKAAGLSQSYWSLLESGSRDPAAVLIRQRQLCERLAVAVGLKLRDLLGDVKG